MLSESSVNEPSVGKLWESESQFSVISIFNLTSTWLFSKGELAHFRGRFSSLFILFFLVFLSLLVSLWCQFCNFCQLHNGGSLFQSKSLYFFHWWMPKYHGNVVLFKQVIKAFSAKYILTKTFFLINATIYNLTNDGG